MVARVGVMSFRVVGIGMVVGEGGVDMGVLDVGGCLWV